MQLVKICREEQLQKNNYARIGANEKSHMKKNLHKLYEYC